MKHTIILTAFERAAFLGAVGESERLRREAAVAQAATESVIAEIVKAHGAPPVATEIGSASLTVTEGRPAMTYDAVGEEPITASTATSVNRVTEVAPATEG